jgi:hypothetical protein
MKAKIDALYADGRTTVMGEEELNDLFNELNKDERSSLQGITL